MLSYQHIYHAGNAVDCQKHVLLSALLAYLPHFHYVDTHAGRGVYDLTAPEAQKIAEFRNGIDLLWSVTDWPPEIRTYQELLEDLNPHGVCDIYPGSPMVAWAHAQQGDRLDLHEIHPREIDDLYDHMDGRAHTHIHNSSGWDALKDGLPHHNATAQGVILIDPSYELKQEYADMASYIADALQQWPNAIIMLWYPILKAARHTDMLDTIRQTIHAPIIQSEIMLAGDQGLQGTGMLVIQPPQGFDTTIERLTAWLAGYIGTTYSVNDVPVTGSLA